MSNGPEDSNDAGGWDGLVDDLDSSRQKPVSPEAVESAPMEIVHQASRHDAGGTFTHEKGLDATGDVRDADFLAGVPDSTLGLDSGQHRSSIAPSRERSSRASLHLPEPAAGASRPATGSTSEMPSLTDRSRLPSFSAPPSAPAGRRRSSGSKNVLLALVLTGVAVVAVAVALSPGTSEDAPRAVTQGPAAPTEGRILVRSAPAGAVIFVDGARTQFRTPHTLTAVPLGRGTNISVQMLGYTAEPPIHRISLDALSAERSANFLLTKAQRIRIESEPPGATVRIDDVPLADLTPVEAPPLAAAETVRIVVSLDGFVPHVFDHEVDPSSPSTLNAVLVPARRLDVTSVPPGAKVFVDGRLQGRTPMEALAIPVSARVQLRLEALGFKPYSKRVNAKKKRLKPIRARLKPAKLGSLDLTDDERGRWEALQLDSARAKADINAARKLSKRARSRRDRELAELSIQAAQSRYDGLREDMRYLRSEVLGRIEDSDASIESP